MMHEPQVEQLGNNLADPAAALRAFSKALGGHAPDWAAREELHQLRYRNEAFPWEVAASLTVEQLLPLALVFDKALRCRFLLGTMTVLEVTPDLDEEDLSRFREETADSPTVTLDLRLDKAALLDRWLKDVPEGCHLVLYLFPAALERLLDLPPDGLAELEELLWPDGAGQKAVILVPAHHVWLDGPYLAVLGGHGVARWRQVLPPAPDAESSKDAEDGRTADLTSIVETRGGELKWDEAWVDELTPLHFDVEGGEEPGDVSIVPLLKRHLVNLVLLYTADRSRRRDDRIWATYSGADVTVDVPLLGVGGIVPSPTGAGAPALLRIFEWGYDPDFSGDKLPLVQVGVARALQAADAEARPRLLLQNAPAIYQGLRYHWKALLESKVDAYVGQVRALEDVVDGTVQAYADQVDDLIDDLAKNALAAVGVVVGSFVGSLFRESFNPLILSIGMLVYALYVYLLPLKFGLPHRWEAYEALKQGFQARRKRFEALLYEERVDEIVGTRVRDSQARFERWFAMAENGYSLLVLVTFGAGVILLIVALAG
jgi:hypothetical protein